MIPLRAIYILSLLVFSSTLAAQAAVSRDLIIQNEMNCVDQHLRLNTSIGWNDVCDVSTDPSLQRERTMNQQMNLLEENYTAQQVITSPQNVVSRQTVTSQQGETPHQNISTQDLEPPGNQQQDWLSEEVPAAYQLPPKRTYWNIEIAPEISHITYNEHSLDKDHGTMFGINGIFTLRPPEGDILNTEISNMYRLESRFSYGKVNYRGGVVDLNTGLSTPESHNGISDYMFEVRPLIGKDYNFSKISTMVTPYLGGGYRYLFDTFSENEPFGYNRRIQYFYLPAGLEATTKLGNGWSVGEDLEYDFFIRGFVTSYLQPLGLGDLNNTQKGGYGLRGSFKLIRTGNRFNVTFEPFFRYWNIHGTSLATSSVGTSGFVIDGQEPRNTSMEIGGRLGVDF